MRKILPLAACSLLALTPAAAAQVLRVPTDVPGLQQAIQSVADGGVIELAAGTYPAPQGGFRIRNLGKGFTVRAAAGATVVLDGEGSHTILDYENSAPARGRRVFFEGLTFRDGFSEEEKVGGAVSLVAADAAFVGCRFEGNASAAPTTGGGAVLIFDGSTAVFVDTTWSGNSATNRGGAVSAVLSTVYIHGGRFEDNRVNLPGHKATSPGGAIYVLDSTVRVFASSFEGNEAGWVGGALYAIGSWAEPVATPSADVLVVGSTFRDNRAAADPCCTPPSPTSGGAFHVENQATLRIHESLLEGNRAEHAGAVSSYRAVVEVHGSVLRGNQATGPEGGLAVGGAFFVTSADFSDPSTDFGAVNRRPGELEVTDSLLQGRFGAVTTAAHSGGCIAIHGDSNRRYGDGGVAQDGSVAENRAPLRMERVVLYDCDVEASPGGTGGEGGGVIARLADAVIRDSLILRSDAPADGGNGGGMAVFDESRLVVSGTTFARNTAEQGGGLFLSGSHVDLATSTFVDNEVTPGVSETVSQSRGAAFYAAPKAAQANPERAADATGVVRECLFTSNVGLPVREIDRSEPPFNRVRYDGNRFYSTTFGDKVYVNNQVSFGGSSVQELNGIVLQRSDGTTTDKSQVANSRLFVAPTEGMLLAVPPSLTSFEGSLPEAVSTLAYARSGAAATLDGTPVAGSSGLMETAAAGEHRLRSGGTQLGAVDVPAPVCTTGPVLCLNDDRFWLEVGWRNFRGRTGAGQAVPLTADTGYFWFFDPANVELVTKVLDARAGTGHFWLFYGALSNVEYHLIGLDTVTGRLRTYDNPAGNFASVGDTGAFPAESVLLGPEERATPEGAAVGPAAPGVDEGTGTGGACVADQTHLCLRGDRFQVEVDWVNFQGVPGVGKAVPLSTDTGYFWFFNRENVEVIVKVLDGRGLNGHFWVFYGALSNVEYELTVTDTETGASRTYSNPRGHFASRGDTEALPGE